MYINNSISLIISIIIGVFVALTLYLTQRYIVVSKHANTDMLTGLMSRRKFSNDLKTYNKKDTCFILIDLDNFKKYNDKYGHDFGDKILIEFARILKSYKFKNVKSYRLGGDEFFLIIPKANNKKANIIIDLIKNEFNETNIIDRKSMKNLSFSFGLYINSNNEKITHKCILEKVDTEMYKKKSIKKNIKKNKNSRRKNR